MKYEGIMTALVTPLDDQNGVDESSLRKLIQFQIKNQVQSLLILGGTGESVQLSLSEKKRAIDIAVSEAKGKLPVIVGIIEPGFGPTVEIGQHAKAAGADAIMVVTPYYVHPGQTGIAEYYRKVDRAVNMPLILYNIPYRTSVNLLPETVEALVKELPNIVAIKECTPNIGQIVDLIRRVGDKISVLCGEEFFAVAEMILGARGAVMASANVVPDVWVKMWRSVKENDVGTAIRLNSDYYPFFKAIFLELNPGPLKEAMRIVGLPAGCVSVPLGTPSAETVGALRESMRKLNIVK